MRRQKALENATPAGIHAIGQGWRTRKPALQCIAGGGGGTSREQSVRARRNLAKAAATKSTRSRQRVAARRESGPDTQAGRSRDSHARREGLEVSVEWPSASAWASTMQACQRHVDRTGQTGETKVLAPALLLSRTDHRNMQKLDLRQWQLGDFNRRQRPRWRWSRTWSRG